MQKRTVSGSGDRRTGATMSLTKQADDRERTTHECGMHYVGTTSNTEGQVCDPRLQNVTAAISAFAIGKLSAIVPAMQVSTYVRQR